MERSNQHELDIETPQFIPQSSINQEMIISKKSKSSMELNVMAETVADI